MIPRNIPENHRMTLRSIATKYSVAENELVRLYQAATDILTTGTTKAPNIMPSKLIHPVTPASCPGHRIELVTVTNLSGVFVQLAIEIQKAAGPVLLTTGKKYSMEGTDSVSSSLQTRMF
jgi:hypothetical protein